MEIIVSKGHSCNHEMPKSRNTVNHQGQTNDHIQSDGKPFGDFIFVSYIVSATCTVRSVQLKVPVSDRLAARSIFYKRSDGYLVPGIERTSSTARPAKHFFRYLGIAVLG
jgi:hypothetical protein